MTTKSLIALLVLPLVLTACGKSESKHSGKRPLTAEQKANIHIAKADSLDVQLEKETQTHESPKLMKLEELKSYRVRLKSFIGHLEAAIKIDDADKGVWAGRDKANGKLVLAKARLMVVDAEIAIREKVKEVAS